MWGRCFCIPTVSECKKFKQIWLQQVGFECPHSTLSPPNPGAKSQKLLPYLRIYCQTWVSMLTMLLLDFVTIHWIQLKSFWGNSFSTENQNLCSIRNRSIWLERSTSCYWISHVCCKVCSKSLFIGVVLFSTRNDFINFQLEPKECLMYFTPWNFITCKYMQ